MKILVSVSASLVKLPNNHNRVRLEAKREIVVLSSDGKVKRSHINKGEHFYIGFPDVVTDMPYVYEEYSDGTVDKTRIKNNAELNRYFRHSTVHKITQKFVQLLTNRGLTIPDEILTAFKLKKVKPDSDHNIVSQADRLAELKRISQVVNVKTKQKTDAEKRQFDDKLSSLMDKLGIKD